MFDDCNENNSEHKKKIDKMEQQRKPKNPLTCCARLIFKKKRVRVDFIFFFLKKINIRWICNRYNGIISSQLAAGTIPITQYFNIASLKEKKNDKKLREKKNRNGRIGTCSRIKNHRQSLWFIDPISLLVLSWIKCYHQGANRT